MHLARQKVQMTLRNEQKICSFCGESHSSCRQKEQFCCPFLMHLARQKVQITFFFYKEDLQKGTKKIALFVERAILHVVKINNFVVLFWCIWQGKKYKWRSFSTKMTFRKEQKKCSFCGESHSSCSQKEQFCCPFLMHLAMQKVQVTFFSREMTFRKEPKKLLFLWREPFFM